MVQRSIEPICRNVCQYRQAKGNLRPQLKNGAQMTRHFRPREYEFVLAHLSVLNHEGMISCGLAGRQPLVMPYPLLLPLLLLAKPKFSVEPQ